MRSPTLKALVRGRGTDPARIGSQLDHLYDRGSRTGWNEDGGGGRRASRRDSPPSRPHDESY